MSLSPEIITVISPHSGATTTTTVNLAIALAAAGKTVLLVDLDFQGHASNFLVQGVHGHGGAYRLLTSALIEREMISATEIPDLYLLPSEPGLKRIESEISLSGDSRTRLCQGLETLQSIALNFDVILIDCPSALGLISINALMAAHRILIPVPAEIASLGGVSILLSINNRLRAGSNRPLHGVHLLATLVKSSEESKEVLSGLRREYGNMTLRTQIPFSNTVQEAAKNNKPILAFCLRCDVSQAYLTLAAEWLALEEIPDLQKGGGWRSMVLRKRVKNLHKVMQDHIEAWIIDPSSLLFDMNEARRHQNLQVLDELSKITKQSHLPAEWISKSQNMHGVFLSVLLLFFSFGFWKLYENGIRTFGNVQEYLDKRQFELNQLLKGIEDVRTKLSERPQGDRKEDRKFLLSLMLLENLERKFAAGEPFGTELLSARAVYPSPEMLSSLESWADTGIPSRSALVEQLRNLRESLHAERINLQRQSLVLNQMFCLRFPDACQSFQDTEKQEQLAQQALEAVYRGEWKSAIETLETVEKATAWIKVVKTRKKLEQQMDQAFRQIWAMFAEEWSAK
ncbi:chromosome partitioning protein [Gammaproteobacteria bacterium]